VVDAQAELVIDCRNELGESPLWCDASATLYWIDVIKPGRVFYWQTETGRVDFWDFDDLVTGLNLVAEGGLLVHGTSDLLRFDPTTRRTLRVFSLPASTKPTRFNDGHCDRAGRLWVGTMANNIGDDGVAIGISEFDGQICRVSGTMSRAFDAHLGCPNAICWSPDGGTFYVGDSCDEWLYSYRFDFDAGTISERRHFCHLAELGIPDGAAVDCDGYIWNARWGAGAVVRISPAGRLDRIVRVPATQPTACCFGGRDRRTLYVTSARFALSADCLRAEPFAGGVFAVRVDVAGLDLSPFVAAGGA
jgi:sugar lactone lactonase YvrE